jgi:uncharacterized membrane protein (DUF4010 family)
MPENWIGLLVALGCGLLVGVERERRKGEGPHRGAAGMRTFALVTLAGALAQSMAPGPLVVAGALAVAALAALAYWRSSGPRTSDPGLTTEVALIVAYLVGVQCVIEPALGAACGVLLAALLAARENMHRFATEWLTELELRDALVLAGVALVVVPLAPAAPLPWLGGLAPRTGAWLVLVILLMQAAAHAARRLLGEGHALALSGLLGGFVSSTATIATFGALARREGPAAQAALAGAAALSGAATWLEAVALCAVASPSLLRALAVPAAAGLAVALVAGAMAAGALAVGRGGKTIATARDRLAERRPLRLREAVAVAALLLTVSAGVAWAQAQFGSGGLWASTALAALADAHAPIAASLAMHRAGTLTANDTLRAALLAVSVNTASRCVVATLSGGPQFAWRVGRVLVSSAAAAWGALLLVH